MLDAPLSTLSVDAEGARRCSTAAVGEEPVENFDMFFDDDEGECESG